MNSTFPERPFTPPEKSPMAIIGAILAQGAIRYLDRQKREERAAAQKIKAMTNRTFTMIKPDATGKGYTGAILQMINNNISNYLSQYLKEDKPDCVPDIRTYFTYSEITNYFTNYKPL